jgi:cobalt-zinc-cadmium efflux system protein
MSHDHTTPQSDHAVTPAHDHDHGHDHGHGHGGHGHSHAPTDFGTAFRLGIAVNIAFVAVEAGAGYAADSVALLADAGHNLSDVLSMVVAWVAARAALRPPSPRFTYGFAKSSILASLINALLLLAAVAVIVFEAIERLITPAPVSAPTMIAVAAIGILVNGVTAWLFARGSDLNIRGVYLHMLADAAISAGVVGAGIAVWWTGWSVIDPLVSLIVAAVIVWGTWSLFTESSALTVAGVPSGIDTTAVRDRLAALPGVSGIHDLHVWALSTTEIALTAHLVMPAGSPGDRFLAEVAEELEEHFGIGHTTLQIETGENGDWCRLVSDRVL